MEIGAEIGVYDGEIKSPVGRHRCILNDAAIIDDVDVHTADFRFHCFKVHLRGIPAGPVVLRHQDRKCLFHIVVVGGIIELEPGIDQLERILDVGFGHGPQTIRILPEVVAGVHITDPDPGKNTDDDNEEDDTHQEIFERYFPIEPIHTSSHLLLPGNAPPQFPVLRSVNRGPCIYTRLQERTGQFLWIVFRWDWCRCNCPDAGPAGLPQKEETGPVGEISCTVPDIPGAHLFSGREMLNLIRGIHI